ncbi:Macrolide export ATP-binding/permease protein MacB 1/2 [Nocardia seriolae]|uniref:Macrolide export ATP-binding/permease protein MacB 1/2 n=2 Tax=Nocardia seriolae TaxID=37332 RepID=A0ABC9Z598_9NOCA|nr:FtsX-like permease family protein [Nocardia seriolae]APA96106.1 Macrolide export ATP-binding/permease protein MacB 1/2 [Nocardia seriolae]WNJ60510.1 FtsX-like permease family protein [Nocardia seriolae]BEK98578.1 FtsX-like permease family protein [Nocardia seriolae]GAM50828.1 membrane protein [Nocardia seriolae]GAP32788.1 membrane protein [Nocardia seriolae]
MSASPMRKVALRNLAAHKVRLVLTVLSVVLGTAFISGSFIFTDTLQSTFDGIFASQAKGVDVRVAPKEPQSLGVPNDVVDKISRMDGVKTVAPSVNGPVVLLKDGHAVQTGGAPTIGQSYLPPGKAVAEPDKYIAGTPPTQPGEIAINKGGADRAGLKVGDNTKVLVPSKGNIDVTVSGIYDLDASNTGGFIALQFDDTQARQLFTDGLHVAYVDIAANPGVQADDLRDQIKKALPDGYKVQDAEQVRDDFKQQLGNALKFINYFLLAFGSIALIVGTFIIYNTFSMLVAQRLRELALLRAVGASRGQISRSVVGESLIVGLIGSALGLAAGVGLAFGLSGLLNAFKLGLPTGTMALEPRTVLVAIGVGTIVTVLSAYAPARRAAKVPPVEAMRSEANSSGESLRVRTIIGAVLAVAGVVLVVLGARGTGGTAASVVGIGAAALILAVLFASPALSRPVVGGLAVLVRPFGPVGKMARNNAIRNPRRTAATAFALTLGLMLVSAIGMLGASAKASVSDLVDKGVKADYILAGPPGGIIGVPLAATDTIEQVPQVKDVVAFHGVALKVDGKQVIGTAPEGPMSKVLNYTMRQGTDQLGDDDIMVSETYASDYDWKLGDSVEVTSLDFKKYKVTVAGIYKDTQLLQNLVVPMALYQKTVPVSYQSSFIVLVAAAPGADLPAMRTNLEKSTEQYVIVQVQDRNDFKGAQGRQIDTLLAILYGLLALAVVIAILGIVNTLALSVVERRREIGMLRAVGMQRPQVRRSIYLESMLIAIFGAIVGVILGIGLGVGFLKTLAELGIATIAVPWGQIVLMLFASGIVGVLAALWPAIRAARTPPLAAIVDV